MSIKSLIKSLIICLLGLVILTGCQASPQEKSDHATTEKLHVVATNSILKDMIENVAGEHATVYSVVPVGQDPHSWEFTPEDVKQASDADLIFYNGLNLETANGWFTKMMTQAHKEENKDYYAVSTAVEPIYLEDRQQQDQQDPHAWLNLANGIKYVERISQVLQEKDPAHASDYQTQAKTYQEKLQSLHDQYLNAFQDIPEDKRLLVTSEGAFKYFRRAYGLDNAYIWEINTEKQGTPEQMKQILNRIHATHVPVLFVETSVDPRTMEKVGQETGLPIYAKIYTDSVGAIDNTDNSQAEKESFQVNTYYGMMHWNLEKIHAGLSQS